MCRGLPEVGKMHFYFIFQMFAFQSIHSSHFSLHFSLHFSVHSDHLSATQRRNERVEGNNEHTLNNQAMKILPVDWLDATIIATDAIG